MYLIILMTYRNSIGLGDFVWNDAAYTSAKSWNNFLAKHNLYGASPVGQNLSKYVAYVITKSLMVLLPMNHILGTSSLKIKYIADSMLRSFLSSPYHEPVLCSEVKTAESNIF
jgi:hypothetical protein